ncbi:reverse transcriptase family protein [Kineosporia sp. NBRC 101677]|uniref:reverse transcriptase family protein n=1 Tax=Kineosporia sp. NBRC 101677 TaxID=3032197 RepID=UPI0025569CF3|nr:reverse transcriptase family protein [Kineosporia sp. NBRC 101677]
MNSSRRRALARALGNAFLTADDWTVRPLVASAEAAIGSRPRWLFRLAREVLAAYPRRPADRPREFARFIELSPILQRAIARALASGQPLRVVSIPPARTRMAPSRPWPVPELHDANDLAELLETEHLEWFADVSFRQRRAKPGPLHHYRYLWTIAASGRPRLLEAPLPRLKRIQRTLLEQVLAPIPVHPAAHGFAPGRSAITGARLHTGAPTVVNLDLASFFTTVSAGRIYGIFRTAGYPEPVAHLLTGLCTTRSPVRVISAMPRSTGDHNEIRSRLRSPHLPQGAPTSPALANLAALALDRRLAGLAASIGLTYTRYADDLTFSGDLSDRAAIRLIGGVERIVRAEGFSVQPAKTRVRHAFQRQVVNGIVVNERPNLTRAEYDQLKALLHNAVRLGPDSQNRDQHGDFRAHLLGRIAWATQLHPERGQRLRAAFDRIEWPADQLNRVTASRSTSAAAARE